MQSLSGVFEALLLGRPQEPGSFVVDFVLQARHWHDPLTLWL